MKTLGFIILFSTFCQNLFCQNSRQLDSLIHKLPTLNNDTVKVKQYIKICNKIVFSDPAKSLEFGTEALILAEKLNWPKGMALAYSVIGDAYENQGDNAKALDFRLKELKIWQELNNQAKMCGVYGNIGVSYSNLGNNLKALEYYVLSLKLAERIDHKKIMVNSQVNIASIFYEQGDLEKALKYYNMALKLAEINNFQNSIAEIDCNIGQIYSQKGKYAEALKYGERALLIFNRLDRKMNMAMVLGNIAINMSLQGDSALRKNNKKMEIEKNLLAIPYLRKALKLSQELNNEYLTASLLGNIGNALRKTGKIKESEDHLNQSMAIATKINAIDLVQENHFNFYELFKQRSEPILSLKHFERYISMKDSISEKDNQKVINELQIRYETEKKETENQALEQQNRILELSLENQRNIILGMIFLTILALGLGFFLVRQNRLKSAQKHALLEQKLLRTQMNPHFIFNSLSSIESFIYEHQPKEAGNYLSQFALLMRLILENSASEYITLEKELETLKCYLSLQKLRLNDNLKYQIHVDDRINTEETRIPPMLTQPFIENVIEHGFRGIKECGVIDITFKLKEGYLEIRVIDNGIGLVQAQQQKELYKDHKSMAIGITYERLKFLNKSKKQKLIFSIKEASGKSDGKGTEVVFSIPV